LCVLGIFKLGSHKLIFQGWPWTTILLISASWVARIAGMSHWSLAGLFISWIHVMRFVKTIIWSYRWLNYHAT
jgi:hypothetical protein